MAEKGVFPRCQYGSFDVTPYVATTYGKRTAKTRFWYGREANKCSNAPKPQLRRRDMMTTGTLLLVLLAIALGDFDH